MRIGTYNVLGLQGYPQEEARKDIGEPEGVKAAQHFSSVFASLECDVLALEEGVSVRQMQRIARRMGCGLATFPSPASWPGHVLSRFPILESRVFSHAAPEEETPPLSRTAGAALIEIPEGGQLWVLVVHLHPGSEEMRDREADIVWRRLGELLGICENAVVLGDFNSQVEERLHRHLREIGFANAMEMVGEQMQPTMDTAGVDRQIIDHIYASPSLKGALSRAQVVRRPGFRSEVPPGGGEWVHSDHLPVVADLDFP